MSTNANSVTRLETGHTPGPMETVKRFIAALEALDFVQAVELCAPDVRWINAPLTTASNRTQFDKALRGMFRMVTRFEVQFRDIHERAGGVVFTDRVDIAEGGGLKMNLPVQGEFRVEDGKIVEWVDRFSWQRVVSELLKSAPAIVRHRLQNL